MIFAHDTEVALNAAAALVNSAHDGETLPDFAALDASSATGAGRASAPTTPPNWTPSARCGPACKPLGGRRGRRGRLVNAMLREADALPQLIKHDQWDYHLHATPSDAGLDVRMMVEAAMAFVDVIRMKELDRLRVCAADDCGDVLVDLSKNRSRRFCDSGCGNRMNVAAYRARQAGRAAG